MEVLLEQECSTERQLDTYKSQARGGGNRENIVVCDVGLCVYSWSLLRGSWSVELVPQTLQTFNNSRTTSQNS